MAQRLDQRIRFVAQGVPFIMSLDTTSAKNEWVLKCILNPEGQSDEISRQLARLAKVLRKQKVSLRLEVDRLIIDAGWEDHHLISDGIALRTDWDGLTLDGLFSATACLIAHTFSLLVRAFGVYHFLRFDSKKIEYGAFDHWRAVHLLRPDSHFDCYENEVPDEEDLALLRLYDRLGLIPCDEDDLGCFDEDDWCDWYDREDSWSFNGTFFTDATDADYDWVDWPVGEAL